MAKDKHSSSEPQPPAKDISSGEVERRLTVLEKSTADLNNRIFDSHKWFVTVLFSAVAVLLGVYGVMSKLDVSNSTREMKQDVKDKMDEIEKRFQLLAGEALKKPLLEISDAQGPLDGQVFEIAQFSAVPFTPLFFKNIGGKRTEPLSIQLYLSANLFSNGSGDWSRAATDDKEFPFSYYSQVAISSRTASVGIAPQETWPLQSEYGVQVYCQMTNVVACKLKVFYGGDKPTEAKFIVKFK